MSTRAPIVFVALHGTRTTWPSRPWEVAMVKVDHDKNPDGETARDSFRVKVRSTKKCDQDALDRTGFYTRHPAGNYLADKAVPRHVPASEYYVDLDVAASRIARFTHNCHVAAFDVAPVAASLQLLLRGEGIEPHWTGRFVDIASQLALHNRLPVVSASTFHPDAPPTSTVALAHAVWARDVWRSLRVTTEIEAEARE